MKINELLVESQNLEEGPFANKVGSAIGKAVGTAAKGVGAVAGGIAGLGAAAKKGFAAGKAKVAAAGDDEEDGMKLADVPNPLLSKFTKTSSGQGAAAPASGAPAPAASGAPAPQTKQAPAPAAPAASGAPATAAPASGAPAQGQAPAASGTMYAQVKANIDKLDKKGKQRILQLLQKQVGTAPAEPAAAPAAAPAPANTMANAPVSKTNKAKPGNPNVTAPAAEPTPADNPQAGASAFGQMANTLSKGKAEPIGQKVPPKKKATSAAPAARNRIKAGADKNKVMNNFTDSLQRHKERMVVEGIANGTVSLYKKK
jgi:hypothetical protein